jgi:hypothetical protein
MRVSVLAAAPLLLTSSFVHALPTIERSDRSLKSWASTIHNVWDIVRDSALGWYNVDVYDELEASYHASDKTIYKWLSEDPK